MTAAAHNCCAVGAMVDVLWDGLKIYFHGTFSRAGQHDNCDSKRIEKVPILKKRSHHAYYLSSAQRGVPTKKYLT